MPVGKCRSQRGKTQTRAAGARHSESLKTRVGARDMVHSVKGLPFTNEEWILVPRRHTKRERIGETPLELLIRSQNCQGFEDLEETRDQ